MGDERHAVATEPATAELNRRTVGVKVLATHDQHRRAHVHLQRTSFAGRGRRGLNRLLARVQEGVVVLGQDRVQRTVSADQAGEAREAIRREP